MNYAEERLEEFVKIAKHDKDFNCVAHSEGQTCCLDEGSERSGRLKSLFTKSIHQAEQEMLDRVAREIKKVIDENDDGLWGCRESFDNLLASLKDPTTL